MDFIHDSLWSGRRYRALAVIDQWSRESLAIEIDVSLTGERVKRVLERLRRSQGPPETILNDNGPEFTGRVLDQWASDNHVQLQFIAEQTDSERVHRILQQPAARGMPEPACVRFAR